MIELYRDKVRKASAARRGDPLYNGSLDHAAVLTEALFANANKEVCILSGELNARVYGIKNVVEQANLFLADREHTARVLIEQPASLDWDNHPLLSAMSDNDNFQVRSVPPQVQQHYSCHLIVTDGDCYRFEQNRDEPVAVAAFGDEVGGRNMLEIFETLWAEGLPIDKPN